MRQARKATWTIKPTLVLRSRDKKKNYFMKLLYCQFSYTYYLNILYCTILP